MKRIHTAPMQTKMTYVWWTLFCTKVRNYQVYYIVHFFFSAYALLEDIGVEKHRMQTRGSCRENWRQLWGDFRAQEGPCTLSRKIALSLLLVTKPTITTTALGSNCFPTSKQLLSCDDALLVVHFTSLWKNLVSHVQGQWGDIRF